MRTDHAQEAGAGGTEDAVVEMDVDIDEMEVDTNATTTPTGRRERERDSRPKKPKPESRLAAVVRRWLANVLPTLPGLPLPAGSSLLEWSVETLVAQAPKRWVVYEPMVLLPTCSFSFSTTTPKVSSQPTSHKSPTSPALPLWQNVLAAVSREQQDQLWRDILLALSPRGGANNAQLTHLAVNEGIPLHTDDNDSSNSENILRSPTGLRPLYGDFGPATTATGGDPTEADFARAFWVSTKQNGLYQTWAPRWSMFSRGNIKEKARLLGWQDGDQRGDRWAVDLYAGIGYFVFSYAQRGLRVLGWELNPWSAEALQRGAARNGWSVRVVRRAADLARPTADVVFSSVGADEGREAERDDTEEEGRTDDDDNDDEPPPIVIFVEDNQHAARRLAELRAVETAASSSAQALGHVGHVNCGLLPTSRAIWQTAWDAVVGGNAQHKMSTSPRTGWLHLHENVGVEELASRQAEIQALVTTWACEVTGTTTGTCSAVVEHVEQVKTFAPGVWHCVFDVRITL